MAGDELQYRRKALEEAFFARRNQQLLEELRAQQDRERRKEALGRLIGTQDPQLIEQVLDLGICPETWAAMAFIPMVAVAWADGVLDTRERKEILEAAQRHGIQPDGPGYKLLEDWLEADPGPAALDAWKNYMLALVGTMEPESRARLRDQVLGLAHEVATAAGGVLGLGAISAREKRVMDELRAVFN